MSDKDIINTNILASKHLKGIFNMNKFTSENPDKIIEDEHKRLKDVLIKNKSIICKRKLTENRIKRRKAVGSEINVLYEDIKKSILNKKNINSANIHEKLKDTIKRISIFNETKKTDLKNDVYEQISAFNKNKTVKNQDFRKLRKIEKIALSSSSEEENDDLNKENLWLIYPESYKKKGIDILIALCTFYTIIFTPFFMAFPDEKDFYINYIDLIVDIMYLFDCIITFFIPFINKDDKLVTTKKNIALNYLSSWFVLDISASLPISSITYIINSEAENDTITKITQIIRLLKFQRMIKVIQMIRMINICKHKKSETFSSLNYFLVFFLGFLFISHFLTCLWIYLTFLDYPNWVVKYGFANSDVFELYIGSLYFNWTTIFTVGYGDITAQNSTERIYTILVMIIGLLTYSFALSSLGNLLTKTDTLTQKYIKNYNILQEIKKTYKIPDSLFIKIFRFLNYNLKNNKNEKYNFISELPPSLKHNILNHMYYDCINNFRFLKFNNDDFRSRVILSLRPVQLVKNEYVVYENEYMEELVLVRNGYLSIRLGNNYNNSPIMKLKKYEHFGDILILSEQRSPVTLKVSVKSVELFYINKNDLIDISKEFPMIFDKIILISTYNYLVMLELVQNKIESLTDKTQSKTVNHQTTKFSNHPSDHNISEVKFDIPIEEEIDYDSSDTSVVSIQEEVIEYNENKQIISIPSNLESYFSNEYKKFISEKAYEISDWQEGRINKTINSYLNKINLEYCT